MNNMTNILGVSAEIIILGLLIVCVLLLVAMVLLVLQVSTLRKRTDRFLGSRSTKRNLETMLTEHTEKVNAMSVKYDDILMLIDDMNNRLHYCVQKVGIVRYNPFDAMGGDLSFAVALLDENDNGIVLNTIHGREASYTYAKPIVNAESSYTLSEEERKAVGIAVNENKIVTAYHGIKGDPPKGHL